MKQTTKNILGVAAIVLLSSGVAGLTTYKILQKNMPADSTSAFNEMFQQNPNVRLASYNAVDAQPVDLTQAAENSVHAVVHIVFVFKIKFVFLCHILAVIRVDKLIRYQLIMN